MYIVYIYIILKKCIYIYMYSCIPTMYAKKNIPMHANKKHSSRGTCPTAIAMFKCNVGHVEKFNQ